MRTVSGFGESDFQVSRSKKSPIVTMSDEKKNPLTISVQAVATDKVGYESEASDAKVLDTVRMRFRMSKRRWAIPTLGNTAR